MADSNKIGIIDEYFIHCMTLKISKSPGERMAKSIPVIAENFQHVTSVL